MATVFLLDIKQNIFAMNAVTCKEIVEILGVSTLEQSLIQPAKPSPHVMMLASIMHQNPSDFHHKIGVCPPYDACASLT